MLGLGGNTTRSSAKRIRSIRPMMGTGGKRMAACPRIDDPSRSDICVIPDSPILDRDECDTLPSAANTEADERASTNARTMRIFIGECLSAKGDRAETVVGSETIRPRRYRVTLSSNQCCGSTADSATGADAPRAQLDVGETTSTVVTASENPI